MDHWNLNRICPLPHESEILHSEGLFDVSDSVGSTARQEGEARLLLD